MKILIYILFTIYYSNSAYTQQFANDSLMNVNLEPINRIITGLPKDSIIESLESKYIELDNIASCLTILEVDVLDSVLKEKVYERLEDFARYYFKIEEPIIILGTGMNSIRKAEELNSKTYEGNLKFISLGNTCLGNWDLESGIQRFNIVTLKLLNIDRLQ